MNDSNGTSSRNRKTFAAKKALALGCFVALAVFAFLKAYDSNLMFSRPADEGVWLFSDSPPMGFNNTTQHGLVPQFAKTLLQPENPNLAAFRIVALMVSLTGFLIYGLGVGWEQKHLSSFAIFVAAILLVWLHPQMFKCSCRATGEFFSVFLICIVMTLAILISRKIKSHLVLLFCICISLLALSTPYGWSLGSAITCATAACSFRKVRNSSLILLVVGLLASNIVWIFEDGRRVQELPFGNYFSWWVGPNLIDFGNSVSIRLLPMEMSNAQFNRIFNVLVLTSIAIAILAKTSRPEARLQGLAVFFFLVIQMVAEIVAGQPSVNPYYLAPVVFLILTLMVLWGKSRKQHLVAILALSLFVLPSLRNSQFNDEQVALQQVAQLANERNANGQEVIFSGSILYFSVYPWLNADARRRSKICVSGAGFFDDAFYARNLIDKSQQIKSDYLLLGKSPSATVVSSKHGQGVRVDIPSSWHATTKSYYYGDPQIEVLYVILANKS